MRVCVSALATVLVSVCYGALENVRVVPFSVPAVYGETGRPVGRIYADSAVQSSSEELAVPFKGDPSLLKTIRLGGKGKRPGFRDGFAVFTVPAFKGENYYSIFLEPEESAPVSTVFEIGGVKFRTAKTVTHPVMEIAGGRVSKSFRIPGVVQTPSGALVAAFDIRYNHSLDLPADIDVGVSISRDGGTTWTVPRVAIPWKDLPGGTGIGDPAILCDPSGVLWIAALRAPVSGHPLFTSSKGTCSPQACGQMIISKSEDGGETWSAPVNITEAVKRMPDSDTAGWGCLFQGPGAGIAMSDGTLVFSAQVWGDKGRAPHSAVLVWSKDKGRTWHSSKAMAFGGSESAVAEIEPGVLLVNTREGAAGKRTSGITRDLGETWEKIPCDVPQPAGLCQGSLLSKDGSVYISNPADLRSRSNMTLRRSLDGGRTWSNGIVYDSREGAGYSSLCTVGGDIGVLYEGACGFHYFMTFPQSDIP